MDGDNLILIISIIILVIMSAYFSATETAFSSLNKIRLKNKAENGSKAAQRAYKISEDYDRLISTILIGNNIVNITATTLGTVFFTKLLDGTSGPTVSTIVLTIVILIFGEVTPKSIAKESPEKFAMFSAPFISLLLIILSPLNLCFTLWKKFINMFIKTEAEPTITGEELISMVSEAENDGEFNKHESEIIRSAIEFSDMTAKEIFIPRVDIVAISEDASSEEIASIFAESGYSRLPVYKDTIDNIIGVIHEKDFYLSRFRGKENISDYISPIKYFSANTQISNMLQIMQKEKQHIAIIVDEFGGTEGLITLEDIIEELVGEIWDEHDEAVEQFKKLDDGSYLIDCSANLADFYDLFSIKGTCEANSVSGWVLEYTETIPNVGDKFRFENMLIKITKSDPKKVIEICVIPDIDNNTQQI